MAEAAWEGTVIGGEMAKKVNRVLDVRQGELCWVPGTVYVDMPLKPNILEDVSKDVSYWSPRTCMSHGRTFCLTYDSAGSLRQHL